MSKQNDEEDDEIECFHESLDRLASSCSCSTSNSDNDSYCSTSEAADDPFTVPRFPMGASTLDVWTSEPASVSERRSRLLREMGLSRDKTLSRVRPDCSDAISREIGNSDVSLFDSSRRLQNHRKSYSCAVAGTSSIFGLKSDPAADRSGDVEHGQCYSSTSNLCSNSILSIPSQAETDNTCPAFVHRDCNQSLQNDDDLSHVTSDNGGSRPSMQKICKRTGKCLSFDAISGYGSPSIIKNRSAGNLVNETYSNGFEMVDTSDQVCLPKNLDNGEEFIVNEIQENGTRRRLTADEFEMFCRHSPIVQELMKRNNVDDASKDATNPNENNHLVGVSKSKKKGGWFRSVRNVASSVTKSKERQSVDDKDISSEKGALRSSSATDDSQDSSFHGPERVKVKQYGKSCKELTALYKSQEIQAHNGSIWCIKFSLDGRYLASAGEDCVIHIWQVVEAEKNGEFLDRPDLLLFPNESPEPTSLLSPRRRGRMSMSRKSLSLESIVIPDSVFGLSEKPVCSFQGHLDDILDLSWSKSQHLLSSSMDKTVRLWHFPTQTCLKTFSHSDYVTCIQFNPIDDRYFISGSLDGKIRIWDIPGRQVVDWYDTREMVTAACYMPDGQTALVGSYKGACRAYDTSDHKLQRKSQINLQNKKKKAHQKKITGFQIVPGSSSEVLITSADSRIRVLDGADLVCKFKGFRNTNSQISASLTADGKFVVSASEDSNVYIWKHEPTSRINRSKGVTVTNSYEHFRCQDVSAAVPWPGTAVTCESRNGFDDVSMAHHPSTPVNKISANHDGLSNGYFLDKMQDFSGLKNRRNRVSRDMSNGLQNTNMNTSAWGMVIVTAGLKGEIRTFQNFGLPVRF